MKMMKWALLGSAALAVTATSAQADELGALKAQLETLQSRVTQLEAQPQASLPSGYSLLSLRDGSGDYDQVPTRASDRIGKNDGVTISVVPAADAAPMAEITVSAEIRTILLYEDVNSRNRDDDDDFLDVRNRTRLNIQGKTDTAVGEVGARVRLQASVEESGSNAGVVLRNGNAWWKFAPAWTLQTGYDDTTAAVQAGYDWETVTPISTGGQSDKLNEYMRLVWNNGGPLSFVIAVEDSDRTEKGDVPAIVGYVAFDNESVFLQAVGVWQTDDTPNGADDWALGAGARFHLGDVFTVSLGGTVGEGYAGYSNNVSPLSNDEDFWTASGILIFNMSDVSHIELGGGIENYSREAVFFGGGIYWDPVSQVTLGLSANYIDFHDFDADHPDGNGTLLSDDLQVAFGTWLRF